MNTETTALAAETPSEIQFDTTTSTPATTPETGSTLGYKAHLATKLIPAPDEAQYQSLKDDIRKRGLLDAIELFDGQVIDGRSRLRACDELGIEPRFVDIATKSPVGYVISKNLHRRHLDANQRAHIAVLMRPFFKAELADPKLRGVPDESSGSAYERELTTRQAKAARAGITATKTLTAVQRHAPEVFDALAGVAGVSVETVKRIASLPKAERPAAIEAALKGKGKRPAKGKSKTRTPKSVKTTTVTKPKAVSYMLKLPGSIVVELKGEKVRLFLKPIKNGGVSVSAHKSPFKVTSPAKRG